MDSDPIGIPLLLGLRLEKFSMSPVSVLKSRELISKLSLKDMEELVSKAT